eukprot:6204183-Pleurochrysis_carterae.AAC.2
MTQRAKTCAQEWTGRKRRSCDEKYDEHEGKSKLEEMRKKVESREALERVGIQLEHGERIVLIEKATQLRVRGRE